MAKEVKEDGFFGIGIFQVKRGENIGTLWRSAFILGASFIFTIDKKYKKQQSDVLQSWKNIPLFHYDTFDEMYKALPYNSQLVAVEMEEESKSLSSFEHPKRAVYLLGAEDNGLPKDILDKCHYKVHLEGSHSLNVAVAGSIVLHDRITRLDVELPELRKTRKVKRRS